MAIRIKFETEIMWPCPNEGHQIRDARPCVSILSKPAASSSMADRIKFEKEIFGEGILWFRLRSANTTTGIEINLRWMILTYAIEE
jgi:hypothetical protein